MVFDYRRPSCLSRRWADLAFGIAGGVLAFRTYQKKNIPEDRQLLALLQRGYDADKQKQRLAAEAELEQEATAELSKLFENEQNSTEKRI